MPEAGAAELARVRWRCRRGMRELDALLSEYVDFRYGAAGSSEREAFLRLLDLPDPDLFGYLVRRADVQEESLRDVVARIRTRAY